MLLFSLIMKRFALLHNICKQKRHKLACKSTNSDNTIQYNTLYLSPTLLVCNVNPLVILYLVIVSVLEQAGLSLIWSDFLKTGLLYGQIIFLKGFKKLDFIKTIFWLSLVLVFCLTIFQSCREGASASWVFTSTLGS